MHQRVWWYDAAALPFEETHTSAHPFFVLIIADADHFPFAKPGQVDSQGRAFRSIRPKVHHADLGFGGDVRGGDEVGVFDLALEYPVLRVFHFQVGWLYVD